MSKIPALGSTKDTQFLERVKEVLEVITGRRRTSTVSLGTVNGTTVDDFSLVDLCRFISGNTTKVTAYLNASPAQVVSLGTWTQVELGTTEKDQLSEFDKTAHLVSVTYAGWYWISGQVQYNNAGDATLYGAAVYINGVEAACAYASGSAASQDLIVSPAARLFYLSAGDTVGLYAGPGGSGAIDLISGAARTYLCISRQI